MKLIWFGDFKYYNYISIGGSLSPELIFCHLVWKLEILLAFERQATIGAVSWMHILGTNSPCLCLSIHLPLHGLWIESLTAINAPMVWATASSFLSLKWLSAQAGIKATEKNKLKRKPSCPRDKLVQCEENLTKYRFFAPQSTLNILTTFPACFSPNLILKQFPAISNDPNHEWWLNWLQM